MLMYMYAWSISENFEWGVDIYWWGAVWYQSVFIINT